MWLYSYGNTPYDYLYHLQGICTALLVPIYGTLLQLTNLRDVILKGLRKGTNIIAR